MAVKKEENTILKELRNEISKLDQILDHAKADMKTLPEGTLRCSSSNGVSQFFIEGKYVGKKNMELIQKIAQRQYYEQVIPIIESILRNLQDIEGLDDPSPIENCYTGLCRARQELVVPVVESMDDKIRKLMQMKYQPGEFKEDNTTEYYTIQGERVRSKSEKIIADELYRYHVPYRYEMPLTLYDHGKEVNCRPDFTVISRSTGNRFIYEHLGMMDNEVYVERNMRKLDLYERNGFLLGKNLVITYETSKMPLRVGVVDSYIEEFLI